jgi:two-component system, NarL family, nitrate/nitrite response regulator NarL
VITPDLLLRGNKMLKNNDERTVPALTQANGAMQSAASQVQTILVSDNALLRTGVKHLLAGTCFHVVEAKSVDGLPEAPNGAPTLFIIDANHRSGTVVESVRQLKARFLGAQVCLLADEFDIGCMIEACKAGADGFCLTTVGRHMLIRSLELILMGQSVLPTKTVRAMGEQLARRPERQPERNASNETAQASTTFAHKLSARESEILRGLMEGAPNKVIARRFGLSEATVKVHVKAILRKIGAGNRTQAAMWAAEHLSAVTGASRNA